MAGSTAGKIDGVCAHCKGSGKAQPGRPIEDPVGGGVPNEPNFGGAIDNASLPSQPKSGGGKPANSASKMPGKRADATAIDGAGGGSADRGSAAATVKPGQVGHNNAATTESDPDEDIWQPSNTWS